MRDFTHQMSRIHYIHHSCSPYAMQGFAESRNVIRGICAPNTPYYASFIRATFCLFIQNLCNVMRDFTHQMSRIHYIHHSCSPYAMQGFAESRNVIRGICAPNTPYYASFIRATFCLFIQNLCNVMRDFTHQMSRIHYIHHSCSPYAMQGFAESRNVIRGICAPNTPYYASFIRATFIHHNYRHFH